MAYWRSLRRAAVLWSCVVLVLVSSACAGGADDEEESASVSPEATTANVVPEASPTLAIVEEPTATATKPPPTPTRTPTPRPTATATPIPEVPIGEVQAIDPQALPNFTLSSSFELTGVPGQENVRMILEIQQSDPDNYHLRVESGQTAIETWVVDGSAYLRQGDGSIVALPEGTDTGLFSPSVFLQAIPPLDPALNAISVGTETVNGRGTTHYYIEGEDFLAGSNLVPGESVTDARGDVDVWIDDELRILIKQVADVQWTNPDGSPGSFMSNYEISNIGSTPPIEEPH